MTAKDALPSGLVIANYGRHLLVETTEGKRLICHSRGKKNTAVVGDRVLWQATQDEGTIEKVQPRRNLFFRQDEIRTKSFAANLDQVLILIAAEPEFSESQLSRALIAAEAEGIKPIIALNKSDLKAPFQYALGKLEAYRKMGYEVLPMALNPRLAADVRAAAAPGSNTVLAGLMALLSKKTTLVLGPSGSGKSTLINLLVPEAHALTGEISTALNSGKHTTTSTTWYWVERDTSTALIDSPGFQEFGLQHIDSMHLAELMPDLKPWIKNCKFYNCSHLHEPGCGLIAELNSSSSNHEISANRYNIYCDLFAELSVSRR